MQHLNFEYSPDSIKPASEVQFHGPIVKPLVKRLDCLSTYTTNTDIELFALISKGDEHAFKEIFIRYTPRLFPFVFDVVKSEAIAREIIQEVLLRVWLKKESLPEIERPSNWLYRVASNISLRHFRRQQTESRILDTIFHKEEDRESGSEDLLSAKELQGLINEATNTLSDQRKKIFQMSREQGLSRREIAERLGISENTVKNQIGFALKHIQDHIQKNIGIYIPGLLIMQALL